MRFLQKVKSKYILLIILALAVFLRLYNISSVPPSASLDEVSIGYNAYSILQTGRDEYGTKFPVILRAYDDWRPALYVYLVIPFVKIFGLSVFAVRLPSVLLSIATVFSVYLLLITLFKKVSLPLEIKPNFLSIGTIFLLTISPWHIYISRLGHEVNAGFSFFIFGFLSFLLRKPYFSISFFILSFVSYQSEKIFIPLFVLIIVFLYRKVLFEKRKHFIIATLVGFIVLIPFMKETLSANALIRLKGTNLFDSQQDRFYEESKKLLISKKNGDVIGEIIHNRRVLAVKIFSEAYVSHFNPEWLFFNSGNEKHKIPRLGFLYPWEAPFIVFGMIILLICKIDKKIKIVLFSWFLLSPLSSSITTDYPHALRSYTFLSTWQLFSALGFFTVYNFFKDKRILALPLVLLILMGSLFYLIKQYFYAFPFQQSESFQYALSQIMPKIKDKEDQYSKIVFSNKDNLYQSYMFFLFYSKYNPYLYQRQGGTKSGGYDERHTFGNYEFRPIFWNKEEKNNTILYVGNKQEFPADVSSLFVGKYLNGEIGVKVVRKM